MIAESGSPVFDGHMASEQVSPLIASLLEDAPRAPVRQTLSPAEMAELTAAAAGESEDARRDQRRRATLAIVSPMLGAAAFAYRSCTVSVHQMTIAVSTTPISMLNS